MHRCTGGRAHARESVQSDGTIRRNQPLNADKCDVPRGDARAYLTSLARLRRRPRRVVAFSGEVIGVGTMQAQV